MIVKITQIKKPAENIRQVLINKSDNYKVIQINKELDKTLSNTSFLTQSNY